MIARHKRIFVWIGLLAAPLASAAQSPNVPVIRLVAREYAFTAPAQAPRGLVRIRLVNRGKVPHYARLVRLDSAKTMADVVTWRRAGGRQPAWFVPVGGPAPVSPGDSADAAAVVQPGRHVVICTYPASGGKSVHLDSGMVREVGVADSADSTSTPNAGLFPHQVLLIRLPDAVSDREEMTWFRDNHQTERPGRPSGGLLELPPRETGWFAVSLRPGRYLLLCGFADGNVRHFDKGMARVVEVGG